MAPESASGPSNHSRISSTSASIAAAFEKVAAPRDAWQAFDAATRAWPEEPVAWIGRGTAKYRQKDFEAAAADYRSALEREPDNAGARNNLAMALLERGCPQAARRELDRIDAAHLGEGLRESILDTDRLIASSEARPDEAACPR